MFRIVLAALLLTPGLVCAQIADSPRGMGMSGLRADPAAGSAVIYNPAGMSTSYQYVIETQYFRVAPGDRNALALNVVDSKAQPQLAVGLNYAFQFADKGSELSENGHDVRLAFAHPAIPNLVHLGLGLRYLSIERSGGAPAEMDGGEVDEMEMASEMMSADESTQSADNNLDGFTLDLGLMLTLTNQIQIGLVGHSLLDVGDRELPRRFGGGVAFVSETLRFDTDVLMDVDSAESGRKSVYVATGLEALVKDSFQVRGGYVFDGAPSHNWLSGGFGFVTGEGGAGGQLSLSYRHNLDDPDAYGFGVSISLYL